MGLKNVIAKHKRGWYEVMDDVQREINRLLFQLDDVASGMEAKWGVGRLEQCVDVAMGEKWARQCERLNEAIEKQDLRVLEELCLGTLRGYGALEKNAMERGYKPNEPMFWETSVDGVVYRFVKTYGDAKSLHRPGAHDVVVITIEEAARCLRVLHAKTFNKRENVGEKPLDAFDFSKGDAIGF